MQVLHASLSETPDDIPQRKPVILENRIEYYANSVVHNSRLLHKIIEASPISIEHVFDKFSDLWISVTFLGRNCFKLREREFLPFPFLIEIYASKKLKIGIKLQLPQ